MVFSSILFLFRFIPIFFILYFICPMRLKLHWRIKNLIILSGSLIFYAWGEPIYVCLMLFSTISDYIHGILIDNCRLAGRKKRAKLFLISSLTINLGMLGFFKYTDFLISTLNRTVGTEIGLLHLALPIGISFYTFQTMSYTIDVYRGEVRAQKDFIAYSAYVTMFPQLVAGPILKYKAVEREITDRRITFSQIAYGIRRFILGLGKKVLLANNIGLLWNHIASQAVGELPVVTAWMGITAFAFQIYFDFSGYSDMAVGLGAALGFHFPENFNYPYISKSITEFWRRWHISLGSWFWEYVYIPLGGNRRGIKRQILNMLLVWCLTGIWHGAGWNFLLWGLWFFVFLAVEKIFLGKILEKSPAVICRIYTMSIVLVSWVLFELPSANEAAMYYKAMFGMQDVGFINRESLYLMSNYGVLFLILILAALPLGKKAMEYIELRLADLAGDCQIPWLLWESIQTILLFGVFIMSVAYLVDATYNPFLYFRF